MVLWVAHALLVHVLSTKQQATLVVQNSHLCINCWRLKSSIHVHVCTASNFQNSHLCVNCWRLKSSIHVHVCTASDFQNSHLCINCWRLKSGIHVCTASDFQTFHDQLRPSDCYEAMKWLPDHETSNRQNHAAVALFEQELSVYHEATKLNSYNTVANSYMYRHAVLEMSRSLLIKKALAMSL